MLSHIEGMGRAYLHPNIDDVTLESVLYALADPHRLAIVKNLAAHGGEMNCNKAGPCDLAKSTLSHHYKILRDGGVIRSEWRGTEVVNRLRTEELDERFPGLMETILASAKED